ncbi:sialidase family protein [Amnibacterium setariae]|uniref:sialidase family protein n=1 Tax=Amnibacterium setariae TaxID=2306585 RepID=UPI0013147C73|nr:sialidase family protein [Amnibacterium setariae]
MSGGPLRRGALAALAAVLLVGGSTLAAAPASAAPRTCAATPFRSDPAKHVWYRIPAVVRTTAGTLLAFAERRDSMAPSSDTGDTDVVVARSTDRGCTWSAPRVVAANGTDTVGNPAPVVDRDTGEVLLLTVDRPRGGTSYHGLHLQRSSDDGRTFTPYDRAGKDLFRLPGWAGGLTGPGHALQLASGPHSGRIVVPIGYERDGRAGAYAIVSDDHGATWSTGFDSQGADHRQEGTVAELPDGRLWISYHEQSASIPVGRGRIAALSSDGGATLSTPFTRLGLPTVSVQASSLVLTGKHAGLLLVSSPGTPDPSVRRVMTIFTSRTAVPGASWTRYPVALDDTPASYSDLVQLDDETVGILYETGRRSWHEGIAFRTVPVAALTAGRATASKAALALPKHARAGRTLVVTARAIVPGTSSPAGSLTVRVTGKHWTRTTTLRIIHGGGGKRVASFARVPKGRYTVSVVYSGSPRIRAATAKAALRVR